LLKLDERIYLNNKMNWIQYLRITRFESVHIWFEKKKIDTCICYIFNRLMFRMSDNTLENILFFRDVC
jgi:hypothetical protein